MAEMFTKSFVESLLKEPIVDFTVKAGSNIGDNMAGEIKALKIETISGKTYNVVIKTLPEEDSSFKEYMRATRTFALEIGMYTEVRKSLEDLVKARGSDFFTLPFPTIYGGVCDGVNDFLCLEDMRPHGYKMPNKYAGLTYAEVKLTLEELAKFHGLTYSLIKYEGEKYFEGGEVGKKLTSSSWADPDVAEMVKPMFGGGLTNAIELLQQRDEKLSLQVKASMDPSDPSKVYDTLMTVGKMTDKKIFPVIIHGDFWMNNILIKYNESGEPVGVKFIDFQQSRRGNIFEELLYFIFTSTTPELRAKHLPQLLSVYFNSFMTSVKILKCPTPTNFSLGSFMDIFYDGYLHAFIYMSFAIPLQLGNFEATGAGADEDKTLMSAERLRVLMDGSPRAVDRLEAIAREFVALKIFS